MRRANPVLRELAATLTLVVVLATFLPTQGVAIAAPATPGTELWEARYNGLGNGGDVATSVAMSPDGSTVFVTGGSEGVGTGLDDYATGAYDAATGKVLWGRHYDGPGSDVDFPTAIAVSPNGSSVFVTGTSEIGDKSDYATVAYDAVTGQLLWGRHYDGPGHDNDRAYSVAVSPDSSMVVVTGYSYAAGSGYDDATVAYDAGTGQRMWVGRYKGSGSSNDHAYSVAVSPNGSTVVVTGDSFTFAPSDYVTVAYDAATGQELWVKRYDDPIHGDDHATALTVSPNSSAVVVTGNSEGSGTVIDYATVTYDLASGKMLWASRYDGAAHSADWAQSMAMSRDGAMVVVTGYGGCGTGTYGDYATVAYGSATGQQLWDACYDGDHSQDYAYSVAVSPNGSTVVVTGRSYLSTGYYGDYATLAYDAVTGQKLWASRYDGPAHGDDSAYSVAVSPDSSMVVVTGESDGTSGILGDYFTIAYSMS